MASNRSVNFEGVDIRDHLEYIFRGSRGHVCLSLLDRNRPGTAPEETFFHWPSQVDELVGAINIARKLDGVEVFYCPYPLKTRERMGGNSAVRRVVHTDADRGLASSLKNQLRRRGFRLVRSGSTGNYHVYGRMSRALTPEEHRGILEAMRTRLDGDNKIADNDLLRIPDTTNWKNLHTNPDKRNDGPMPVEIEAYGSHKIDVAELMAWLGAKPIAVRAARAKEAWQKVDIKDVDPKLVKVARISVDEAVGRYHSRHGAVWATTRELATNGLSSDQIHTLMDDFPAAIDKAEDERGYKVHRDVERCLLEFDLTEGKELAIVDPNHDFWDRRESLRHIKAYAYASTANPWGTLGVVLLRVLFTVPTNVLLPGQNGGKTGTRALNMFVTLVGESGSGKKTATDAATSVFDMGFITNYLPIGSGEGISKAYRRRGKTKDEPEMVIKNTRVIFDVAEVSTWNNLVGRSGSTLTGEVLKAFSGEGLGFSNSDEERTIHVPANSYRMCLVLGAQPGTAGKLLADKDSGLPQRFLWMPTHVDKADYDFDNMPTPPESQEWIGPEFRSSDKDYVLSFPDDVKLEAVKARFANDDDKMESQAIVIKLRVAAALALLDGRAKVNEEDWYLAGKVMYQSRRTRRSVTDYLAEVGRKEAARKGHINAITKRAEDQAIEKLVNEDVQRVADWVMKKIDEEQGNRVKHNDLRRACASRNRKYFDQAIELLKEEKKVTVREVTLKTGISTTYTRRD